MSIYLDGWNAYRSSIPNTHARHWPTARREMWEKGWSDAQAEDGAGTRPSAARPHAGDIGARGAASSEGR